MLVLALALVTGCGQSAAPTSPTAPRATTLLNVSAASSLKSVLTSIAPAFEKENRVKLAFNFGASGVLMKQIEGGSPTDVFLSAGATETFAGNDLVILVPAGDPRGIHGPNDLAKATRLTTGDPAVAPHGAKAQEWLTGLGMWDTLKPKFVFAANAAQTDDYVARGEVDAGTGFASDAKGRKDIEIAYTVPAGVVEPVKYVAAPIKTSSQAELASQFVTYMLSSEVQTALTEARFKPAPTK
jgi:molybdate transport system substrate-binding protein